jgi:hypothetical protein
MADTLHQLTFQVTHAQWTEEFEHLLIAGRSRCELQAVVLGIVGVVGSQNGQFQLLFVFLWLFLRRLLCR